MIIGIFIVIGLVILWAILFGGILLLMNKLMDIWENTNNDFWYAVVWVVSMAGMLIAFILPISLGFIILPTYFN